MSASPCRPTFSLSLKPSGLATELREQHKGMVSMMNHGKHSYLMIALVGAGAVLFLTGNASSLLFLLWPLACMAMMAWMMWGMGSMSSKPADPQDDHADDTLTHAHR